jgi:hypothetical protein
MATTENKPADDKKKKRGRRKPGVDILKNRKDVIFTLWDIKTDKPIVNSAGNMLKFKGGYMVRILADKIRDKISPADAAIRIVKRMFAANPEKAHNRTFCIKCISKCKYKNWIFGYKIFVSKASKDVIQSRLNFMQKMQDERAKLNKQEPQKINIKSNSYKYNFKAIKTFEIDHSKIKRDMYQKERKKPTKKTDKSNTKQTNKVEEKKNDKPSTAPQTKNDKPSTAQQTKNNKPSTAQKTKKKKNEEGDMKIYIEEYQEDNKNTKK